MLYLCANPAWTQGDCAGAPAVRSAQIGPEDSLPTIPVDAGDNRISPTAITVTGGTLVEAVDGHPVWDADVITPPEQPLQEDDGIAVLRGNLAPRGAIVKPAAASPELLVHRDQQ